MNPSQKISVIERSLRCCRYGYLSLIPLIGIVMAILTFRDIRFVHKNCGQEWNPANARLKLGKTLAVVGLFISMLVVCFAVYAIFIEPNFGSGQDYFGCGPIYDSD